MESICDSLPVRDITSVSPAGQPIVMPLELERSVRTGWRVRYQKSTTVLADKARVAGHRSQFGGVLRP